MSLADFFDPGFEDDGRDDGFFGGEHFEDDIPIGELDVSAPVLSGVGGRPFRGTYLIARHGDRVLTPEGWMDLDELPNYEKPTFW
jgi:hypothetical protein